MTSPDDPLVPIAFEVFARLGIKKGTMADVAAAAGVSRQTVYNRFANKDEVLRATTTFIVNQQLNCLATQWADADTLSEKIECFYQAAPIYWYDMFAATPDAEALMEGVYTAAQEEMAEATTKWNTALATMLHSYGNTLGAIGQTPADLADFLYSSAYTAKANATDRDHLLRRLATLKAAVLALLGER